MDDTEEEGSFPAMTPLDDKKCTRLTGCKKAECFTCNKSGTGTHHVWDLSQELGTTPPPKKTTKPPAPPDRIFSITADLQQAVLDDDLKEIQILLTFFYFHVKTL